ncbi:hypothetical protein OE88DRAFT_1654310 [Heliocybe sulcata]|uniref:Serine hydrolase domain-containing protein n=1 Tax=Heliocybe sulcata TaxID=5364 RepID=A0A5C3N9K6_9AGAM|nr:hypothetical protein OE88DRAFT_1654310 [Heliocybe sulcata]
MVSTPRKVLVLHGYSQNASIFKDWFAPVQAAFAQDNLEFVFIEGARVLTQDDVPVTFTPSPDLPFVVDIPKNLDNPTLVPRAWWKSYPDNDDTTGLEKSIEAFRDILRNDRFEGIIGFSQGSTMSVILTALLEKPDVYPPFLVDGKAPHPPFTFCVAISGHLPRSSLLPKLFSTPAKTRTLHIQGTSDDITPKEQNQTLVDVSSVNGKYVTHGGGHVIPTESGWLELIRQFVLDPSADLALPENAGVV